MGPNDPRWKECNSVTPTYGWQQDGLRITQGSSFPLLDHGDGSYAHLLSFQFLCNWGLTQTRLAWELEWDKVSRQRAWVEADLKDRKYRNRKKRKR